MEQTSATANLAVSPAMRPFALPLGLASPMWMAYGAAASVGATWWWIARMSRFVTPHLAEAVVTEAPTDQPYALVEASGTERFEAAPSPIALSAAEPVGAPLEVLPDELTLLRGVGPRVADALVARGVTTFAQLAAWTDDELAVFDADLKLLGRSKRYDFIGQAREMAQSV